MIRRTRAPRVVVALYTVASLLLLLYTVGAPVTQGP